MEAGDPFVEPDAKRRRNPAEATAAIRKSRDARWGIDTSAAWWALKALTISWDAVMRDSLHEPPTARAHARRRARATVTGEMATSPRGIWTAASNVAEERNSRLRSPPTPRPTRPPIPANTDAAMNSTPRTPSTERPRAISP